MRNKKLITVQKELQIKNNGEIILRVMDNNAIRIRLKLGISCALRKEKLEFPLWAKKSSKYTDWLNGALLIF